MRGQEAAAIVTDKATDTQLVDAHRLRLRERLRAEWIAGAEEEWRKRTGRPMTAEELQRVLRRYPGDAPDGRTRANPMTRPR